MECQWKTNLITRAEGRITLGFSIGPEDEVYYHQLVNIEEGGSEDEVEE